MDKICVETMFFNVASNVSVARLDVWTVLWYNRHALCRLNGSKQNANKNDC